MMIELHVIKSMNSGEDRVQHMKMYDPHRLESILCGHMTHHCGQRIMSQCCTWCNIMFTTIQWCLFVFIFYRIKFSKSGKIQARKWKHMIHKWWDHWRVSNWISNMIKAGNKHRRKIYQVGHGNSVVLTVVVMWTGLYEANACCVDGSLPTDK